MTPEHNLHLTLAFLGEIPEQNVPAADSALHGLSIGESSGSLELGEIGAFPRNGDPRVVWIGVTSGASLVEDLHGTIVSVLEERGLPFDGKPFKPHLTVGRCTKVRRSRDRRRSTPAPPPGEQERSPGSAVSPAAAVRSMQKSLEGVRWTVPCTEVTLYESKLTPGGAVHTIRATSKT